MKIATLLIPKFERIDLMLHHQHFEKAMHEVQELLSSDPMNFYAQVLKHKLEQLLNDTTFDASVHTEKKTLSALRQLCTMAIARILKMSVTNRVTHMNETLRLKALEEKSNEWLRHARQHYLSQNYSEAYNEVTRALMLNPANAEAQELKATLEAYLSKNLSDHNQSTGDLSSFDTSVSSAQTLYDKVLACIEFAEYYRSQGDDETCRKYIEDGLQYDPDNEVLRTMKQELDREGVVVESSS